MDGSSAAPPSMPGSSMASDSELSSLAKKNAVLLEYRLTSMLLALVATIAGDEHDTPKYDPPLERSSSHRTLNALANILVRNTEIVAVTATAVHLAHDSAPAETLEVFAVQAEADESPSTTTSSSPSETLSNVTMIPNTEWSDATIIPEGSWFTTIGQGESKLSKIRDKPWSFTYVKSNHMLPLPEHIATVVQYLKEYQSGTDSSRGDLFDDFSTYLLSTSYPKIRRRLCTRASKTFRHILSSITGPDLDKCIEKGFPEPKLSQPSDVLLCEAVISASSTGRNKIKDIVRDLRGGHYNTPTEEPSALFEEITAMFNAHSGTQPRPDSLPCLYTRFTCVDFHYLLLHTLHQFQEAIKAFSDGQPEGSHEDLLSYSFLLWRLANSSALNSHLLFIQDLLRDRLRGGMRPRAKDNKGDSNDDLGHSGGDGGMGPRVKDNKGGSSDDLGHSGGDGGAGENCELDSEIEAIENDNQHKMEPGLMVQRWINLLVSHLQALRILSKFSSLHPTAEIKIKQVAVKRTTFDTPQDWTAVLERTVKGHALESQLPDLKSLILDGIQDVQEAQTRKGIYGYFDGINIISPGGQVHCEAGLAAYLDLTCGAPCLAQEKPAPVFAVSKLCCPLCWDLLGAYQGDRFGVRGHHSVPTAVELPGSISLDSAEELLLLLRRRLYEKLRVLAKTRGKHRRNNSVQSIGSVASDDSNPGDGARNITVKVKKFRRPS